MAPVFVDLEADDDDGDEDDEDVGDDGKVPDVLEVGTPVKFSAENRSLRLVLFKAESRPLWICELIRLFFFHKYAGSRISSYFV